MMVSHLMNAMMRICHTSVKSTSPMLSCSCPLAYKSRENDRVSVPVSQGRLRPFRFKFHAVMNGDGFKS